MSCTIPSTSGRAKGPRELERSSHDEMHFAPREPFPRQSWARCSISRWRDWRTVGDRWSRRRSPFRGSGLDVMEFRVLDFVDRMAHRAAESRTVTVNLAQGVVATRLNRAMSSSGLRLDRRRARIKIVKPDILSLVIIGHPGLSDDEGEISSGFLRLRERHESVEAFRDHEDTAEILLSSCSGP
jgi:hypothetical protein